MKIKAKVVFSEFVTREFDIDCGLGNQYISWLAKTACLKFGQVHYPKGIYIPNLLHKDKDPEDWPHPRRRINEKLSDKEVVVVTLKDRTKEQTVNEEEWYQMAFGPKQNIMTIKIDFTPKKVDALKKGRNDIYAVVKYSMYEEMVGEFKKEDFPADDNRKLDASEYEGVGFNYSAIFEYPYGDIDIQLMYDKAGKNKEKEPGLKLEVIPPEEDDFSIKQDPEPISLAKLKEIHAKEEDENKQREAEARMAQKRLEEEKARLRYEQQQQIAKQEQNTQQLKIYFEAMNLGFHQGEEDFNASMSVLSIYHQELMDNFRYYSGLHEQRFQKEENMYIIMQSFINWMKVMGIANSREEASAAAECMHEIDFVHIPFQDTLNINNTLNYAQFLEAILRIAYYKKDNSQEKGSPDGFKNTLEAMFADVELDVKKKSKQDEILANLMDLSNSGFLAHNFDLLGAIFSEKGMPKGDHHEMGKDEFINMLKDSDLLIIPKKKPGDAPAAGAKPKAGAAETETKDKEEENKEPDLKFDGEDVLKVIENAHSFEEDQLGYVDFLEALVRLAHAYPFKEEQLADMPTFEIRMMFFIQALETKFKNLKQLFAQKVDAKTMEHSYQPCVVVDEDEDDDVEMD